MAGRLTMQNLMGRSNIMTVYTYGMTFIGLNSNCEFFALDFIRHKLTHVSLMPIPLEKEVDEFVQKHNPINGRIRGIFSVNRKAPESENFAEVVYQPHGLKMQGHAFAAVQEAQPSMLKESVGEPAVRVRHSGSYGLLDREGAQRRAADHRASSNSAKVPSVKNFRSGADLKNIIMPEFDEMLTLRKIYWIVINNELCQKK
eukprot:851388_1